MKSQISQISNEELNDNKIKHAINKISNKKQAKKIEFHMIKDKEMKENVIGFDKLDDVEIDYIFDCIKKYKKKDKRSIADKEFIKLRTL